MFVYVIVNSETLKIYIGQHKGLNLRQYLQQKWYEAHKYLSHRSRLYASMRKHPRESWSIHPLQAELQTRAECDDWEKHYIKVLKTQHPDVGYNICRGGEGFTGEFSEESKQKMSVGHKKSWQDGSQKREEQRKNCSRAGKINGLKAKEAGTGIHAFTQEQRQEVGRAAGKISGEANGIRAVETGHIYRISQLPQAKEAQRRVGLAHVASGQLDRIRKLPQATAARKRKAAENQANKIGLFALTHDERSVFGKQGAVVGQHRRWHIARNLTNSNCPLCIQNAEKVS
jgi:hypothetical protein